MIRKVRDAKKVFAKSSLIWTVCVKGCRIKTEQVQRFMSNVSFEKVFGVGISELGETGGLLFFGNRKVADT